MGCPACLIPLLAAGLLSCRSAAPQDGPAPEGPALALEGAAWTFCELQGQALEVGLDDRDVHLHLRPDDKTVAGTSGLNQFSGSYELDGDALRFGPLAMTRRAGPEPLMRQEASLVQALGRTVAWRHAGQEIELLDAAGEALARLESGPAQDPK